MKRLICLVLILVLVLSLCPAGIVAAEEKTSQPSRYTILIIEANTGTRYWSDGEVIYTAYSALKEIKNAAIDFVEQALEHDSNHKIAIISYNSDVYVKSSFSNNERQLKSAINGCSNSKNNNIEAALSKANAMLDEIKEKNALKNVVVFSSGKPDGGESGSYDYDSGPYTVNTVASDWHNIDTKIHYYAYANAALKQADLIKEKATLYSIGLYSAYDGAPEAFPPLQFFKKFAQDLASDGNHHYLEVTDFSKLYTLFGEITEEIIREMLDSDGDSFYDEWEINGYDADGDGIIDVDLPAMGADPNVPDIFVEVDWMVKPATTITGFELLAEESFAPDHIYMEEVYLAFKRHDINLHVDAGPDSVDFVTGKKWGKLSGGSEVPYVKEIRAEADLWPTEMDPARERIFRHAIFCDKVFTPEYNMFNQMVYKRTGGVTHGYYDQYFLVGNPTANSYAVSNRIAVAIFMHELGHTLGLKHGGSDNINYKPNYLSIMNYLFQNTGLVGTNALDYSNYVLPTINEAAIDETLGVDPEGITAGTGLGTKLSNKWFYNWLTTDRIIEEISRAPLDINGNLIIDKKTYELDLTPDGNIGKKTITTLVSHNDWENLKFEVGNIRKEKDESLPNYNFIHMAGALYQEWIDTVGERDFGHEPTAQEFLEQGLLGNEGAGNITSGGLYTIIQGMAGQNVYVHVSNLYTEEQTFTVEVAASEITDAYSSSVTLPGSQGTLSYVNIPLAIKKDAKAGEYTIKATLKHPGVNDVTCEIPVLVREATEGELQKLADALVEESASLPQHVASDYIHLLSNEGYANLEDYDPIYRQIILKIDDCNATVFGKQVTNDVPPIIANSRTMLPIRFVAEALGAKVGWDNDNREVTIIREDIEIRIQIGANSATVNGETISLDSPAFIQNSRTYLPLRFVASHLGAQVDWDGTTRTVTITK